MTLPPKNAELAVKERLARAGCGSKAQAEESDGLTFSGIGSWL